MRLELVAEGLLQPEGPVAMPDGSVILVEMRRGAVSRVDPRGRIEVIATPGGCPNGAALGPDGALYVCNSGGFEWHEIDGLWFAGDQSHDYSGGRIERVDLATGEVTVLYESCEGNPLKGPNDIVFDAHGGFYFTDFGKSFGRLHDRGAVFYAQPDGSSIREIVFPLQTPNGVGLSPDGRTLYVAESITARLWAYALEGPGVVRKEGLMGGRCVAGAGGFQIFDSLAVTQDGAICVATVINGGVTIITPDGGMSHVPTEDALTTNICFGGDDLRTAYITLTGSGRLVRCAWPAAGAPLPFVNT